MAKTKLMALAFGIVLVCAVAVRLYAAMSISSTDVPHAIPDPGTVSSTLNWTIGSATGPTATDVNILVNISHNWDSDVFVTLTAPGAVGPFTLWNNCGGSSRNLNVVIDDQSASQLDCGVSSSTHTVAGTAQSSTSTVNAGATTVAQRTANATQMGAYNVNPFGTWTLVSGDDSAVCTGTLNSWSLTIDGPPPLPVELMRIETQ